MKKMTLIIAICIAVQISFAQKQITKIAFGSCSEEERKEQMWSDIVAQAPQLWIWLGDNIYADTHDMNFLRAQYQKQKENTDYQKLIATCLIIGTWDDHDYGINDSGKNYSRKKESKEEMLRFLDVPANDPVRKHEGVYSAHTYGSGEKKVKVLLLDTRYFRDTLFKSDDPTKRYTANPTGDVLGEAQWNWLENELKNSEAAIHIIGSSIQFVAEDHGYEKWANFPIARERMIKMLGRVKPRNTFIISGDRHIAEISAMKIPGLPYELCDFTSSGLTHTWSDSGMDSEINSHRVGDLIIQKTFGMLLIDWSTGQPSVKLQVRGYRNALYEERVLKFESVK